MAIDLAIERSLGVRGDWTAEETVGGGLILSAQYARWRSGVEYGVHGACPVLSSTPCLLTFILRH
jgi:hypothetical protein